MSGRLRHYVCGSTSHDLAAMFRGGAHEVRQFPSGVFLYDGAGGQRVLFDTGYAAGEWNTGWRGAVYRCLLPPKIASTDDIARQLREDGVDPVSVTHVVLSHLHPDHVGGVAHFPGATFVLTSGLQRSLHAPRLRAGILTGLFPPWFGDAATLVLDEEAFLATEVAGVPIRAADLLGDGSYLILDLPGHADGHVGAVIEGRVLIAGDAGWGRDLLGAADDLRALPRAVQHDYAEYTRTAVRLQEIAAAGVHIVCSHDPLVEKELLS
ncbi:MBL fold metallo-hydrolase [Microbacterium sp. PMB16]|uniref:MBL fold metallo-hydrolase n=1 Tax=Microbacterium sp. PMB16 TaxID=3120157 RepID=UPI003F4B5D9F